MRDPIVYKCPECGQTWRMSDDPNDWSFGHDCEVS